MDRVELIHRLLPAAGRYLEIGCGADRTFSRIDAAVKVGVDPARGGTLRMTSDEFFARREGWNFDVVFIDGLHLAEQVLRDVDQALERLSPGGAIVLHDVRPTREETQRRERVPGSGAWHGDVWKAFVTIRQRHDLDAATLMCDQGLGIILPRNNTALLESPGELSWERYQSHCREWLRPIEDVGEFVRTHAFGLVTRFNLGRTDAAWLDHRLQLFRRFTRPSILAQTDQRYWWIIACDPRTPEAVRRELVFAAPNSLVVCQNQFRPEVRRLLTNWGRPWVVTTRLDNDDMIAADYLATIRRQVRPQREFLTAPEGLVYHEGRVCDRHYPGNPFISLCDAAGGEDVYAINHSQMDRQRHRVISESPMWCQVLHDRNQRNAMRPEFREWRDWDTVSGRFGQPS